jgi:hypothetical protein
MYPLSGDLFDYCLSTVRTIGTRPLSDNSTGVPFEATSFQACCMPASRSSWLTGCRRFCRLNRLRRLRAIHSLIPRPSQPSPAFKTHNTTVPNGFLQVAVSKTLPAIMNAAPGLLLAGSVPDTALILRGRSRRNRRHILAMTVMRQNESARDSQELSDSV